MYEVWGEGNSKEELIDAVSSYPEERKAPYLAKDHTFKIVVDRFGKVLSSSEQKACIESIDYVPFQVYTLLHFCFFLMYFFKKIALEEDVDFSILMSYFVSLAPCSRASVLF
jgi:hypothetical protein